MKRIAGLHSIGSGPAGDGPLASPACLLYVDLDRDRPSGGRSGGWASGSTWPCWSASIWPLALGLAIGLVAPAAGVPDLRHAVRPPSTPRSPGARAGLRRADRPDVHGLRGLPAGRSASSSTRWSAVRPRRLYAIARLSVYEANRRMWAPWVVITVFLLVLAFTHWFLQPPRPAEMGRLYVGTLTLLCSLLLTVMVTILTPLSLPHGHPAADDLHGGLQAGAPARDDLGPDDRLHGAGDRAGGRLRRDQPGLPVADGRRARSTDDRRDGDEGREGEPAGGGQAARSRPTSSAPG